MWAIGASPINLIPMTLAATGPHWFEALPATVTQLPAAEALTWLRGLTHSDSPVDPVRSLRANIIPEHDAQQAASLGSWTLLVGGLYVGYRVVRFGLRLHAEWLDRYRPFRSLAEFNQEFVSETPSLRGAWEVFKSSFGPRRAKISYTVHLSFGEQPGGGETDRLAADIMAAVKSQGQALQEIPAPQWQRWVGDGEINRFGAELTRRFVALFKEELADCRREACVIMGQAADDPLLPRGSYRTGQVAKLMERLYTLVRSFGTGLDAMTVRDERFIYYRFVIGGFVSELARVLTQTGWEVITSAKRGKWWDVAWHWDKAMEPAAGAIENLSEIAGLMETGQLTQ